jgi:hypothetical protein
VLLPRRRRPLELNDVLERELVEPVAVAGALHEIEQREPRERRQPRVVIGRDALFEQRARRRGLPARVEQRGVLEHRAEPGVRLHDLERGMRRRRGLEQARPGHRDVGADGLHRRPLGLALLAERLRREVARRRPLGRRRHGPRLGDGWRRLLGGRLGEEGHRGSRRPGRSGGLR